MTENIEFWEDSHVTLVGSLGSDARVVEAARVSTQGEGSRGQEADEGLIRFLLRNGHWSPFEHPTATFLIETSLFTRSQIIRHKSFSFNEESARYRQMRPRFYIPPKTRPIRQFGKPGTYVMEEDMDAVVAARTAFRTAAFRSWGAYVSLLNEGVARELARAVLPQHLITSFYMTGSLRSWIHFLRARGDFHAQFEVQQVAPRIRAELTKLFPVTMREALTD